MTTFLKNKFEIFQDQLPPEKVKLLTEWDQHFFPWPWKTDVWPKDFKNYVACFAFDEKETIAMALFQVTDSEGPIHLLKIMVHPSSRQKGLGEIFFTQCLQELKKRGLNRCFLEVSSQNPAAIRLYQKCGFHQFHQIPGFYRDGSCALTMGNYQ